MSACKATGGSADSAAERPAAAIDRRDGFEVELWAEGMAVPTGLAFLPDGSALVTEKGGFDRVGEGRLVHLRGDGDWRPILTLPVCADFERGLLGVAVDPAFESNGLVYLYRTYDPRGECESDPGPFAERTGTTRNVLSRFTWADDTIDPDSEVVLVDEIAGTSSAHQGGGLAFGPDGMLYVTVGGNAQDTDSTVASRDPSRLEGKVLRISTDPNGLAPLDNPFVGDPKAHPLVWALGFRNPFGLDVHPAEGTVILADVGSEGHEELNLAVAGGDYGWPQREGFEEGPFPGDATSTIDPIHVYDHSDGCRAIIAGGFLVGEGMGPDTSGRFAFTDFACGRVWLIDYSSADREVHYIAHIPHGKSDLTVGPDGLIYVVGIEGVVWRVRPKQAVAP